MATLSTGIVGISDKIGETNVQLVNRSIMADGKILRPSRPIAIPDYLIPKWGVFIFYELQRAPLYFVRGPLFCKISDSKFLRCMK